MTGPATINQPLSKNRSRFPHRLSQLIRTASPGTLRLASIVAATAWFPLGILASLHGFVSVKAFLLDFAVQSRIFIVIPLLILMEPSLAARLEFVAHHFVEADLVRKADYPRFEKMFATFREQSVSPMARIAILLLCSCFVAYALGYFQASRFPVWAYAADGAGPMLAAGYWYIFAALPAMLYLSFQWVWRQLLWSRFLWSVSRLDLRLIAAHPDQMGGLGFVQTCLRGYLPFSFAIGTIVAGGVANRIIHLHQPMLAYKYAPLVVLAFVFVLFVAPFSAFLGILVRTKTRGIFEYGSLGSGLGRQFETKWFGPGRELDAAILEKPDFSATIDLYSVIAFAQNMKLFPVGLQSLSELTATTLAPAIPIALFAVPFDVLLEHAMKLVL